jgi:3'(2'), 5'-bisphosphate nucleotidase
MQVDHTLLSRVEAIARAAGDAIMEVYARGATAVQLKADDSPLTEADLRAHRLIVERLSSLEPALPVLSEEASDIPAQVRHGWSRYWLVDPLDGTREFLSRNGEFTVNIALIDHHQPMLGVVHVPARAESFMGAVGAGAWRVGSARSPQPLQVSAISASPPRVAGSRSHRGDSLDAFLKALGAHRFLAVGSSLKFCLLASGEADVYPRLGPTSEWDIAAGHALLLAAGGSVLQLDGSPVEYNRRDSLQSPQFVAIAARDRDWLALLRAPDCKTATSSL